MKEATEPTRFFDPETRGTIVLQMEPDGARFRILRQFGYSDPAYPDEPFIVPLNVATFRTDLASIPWFFAWLVPGLGSHLPAVLVHDALVLKRGEAKAHEGPEVDREEADRILRDAMRSLGTPFIRRWLMWAAVMLATAFVSLRPRLRWWPTAGGSLLLVGGLGVVATLDLFDAVDWLRWMGERPWFAELASGALFAVLVPAALSLLWGKRWRVGFIAGVALALLLHVTVAVALVFGIYRLLEKLASLWDGASPSAAANLEEADSSEGMYLPAE